MFKELLPIGSVVLLMGGIRKLMITGIKVSTPEQEDTMFDYIGVLYPEGFMGEVGNFMFNHSDISDVIFKGYSNPERDVFINFLEENWKTEENKSEETKKVEDE